MKRILRRLHLLAYFASVLFFFALGFPFLYYFARNADRHYHKIVSFRRWISLAGIYAVGIRVEVEYEAPIDWSKNYVLCPNHTSFLDITVLNYLCKAPFSFIGKMELLNNPVTRIFFKTIDIPVKRDSRISSFKAYKRASTLLQEGRSIVIFPEGKIDETYPPVLQQFKSGAFRMATENDIPILPVVIQDAWHILWDDGKVYGSRPGVIHVKVMAPIQTANYHSRHFSSLEAEVYDKMKEAWEICNKS
ncbi:MAG TPA: lysophospholipid acyltransferase family protein [Sphingobacterium sp.]|jgi:1-acyl-sn-glycerol-3-phosphate acyltransferase|nr:lysophospholipid acyltransferase family protein [Sphingobacterium sp.]